MESIENSFTILVNKYSSISGNNLFASLPISIQLRSQKCQREICIIGFCVLPFTCVLSRTHLMTYLHKFWACLLTVVIPSCAAGELYTAHFWLHHRIKVLNTAQWNILCSNKWMWFYLFNLHLIECSRVYAASRKCRRSGCTVIHQLLNANDIFLFQFYFDILFDFNSLYLNSC